MPPGPPNPPRRCWRITTEPDDLQEGLFGQALLWVGEVLPSLARLGVAPQWDIRSRLYGSGPELRLLPGVLDTVHTPLHAAPPTRSVSLIALRVRHVSVLGHDWQALHALWQQFFRVPQRLVDRAESLALPAATLGVHYRGTDKNLQLRDTNPVSIDDMLSLVAEALDTQPLQALFIATDEHAFVDAALRRFPGVPITNLGPVPFHKADPPPSGKADRAMLDCLLLSRCARVLKCSSALSGFAKLLNPALDVQRVAASKSFFGGIPYFPDAYIPPLTGRSAATRAILARQLAGDWIEDPALAARFGRPFVWMPRYTPTQAAVNGLKNVAARLRGRRRVA